MNKVYKLICFDVDGTLVETGSGGPFRKTADDWQFLPGRVEKCQQLLSQYIHLAIASNQGGVAFGLLDEDEITDEINKTARAIGAAHVGICFLHPKAKIASYLGDSPRRKPGPGMLFEAMMYFNVFAPDTLYVGDRPEDEEAAKNAGVDFEWAKDFFGDVK